CLDMGSTVQRHLPRTPAPGRAGEVGRIVRSRKGKCGAPTGRCSAPGRPLARIQRLGAVGKRRRSIASGMLRAAPHRPEQETSAAWDGIPLPILQRNVLQTCPELAKGLVLNTNRPVLTVRLAPVGPERHA